MSYKIFISKKVEKYLSNIDINTAKRIRDSIRALSENPRPIGTLKLTGEKNSYRIRIGIYRIIYEIHDYKLLIVIVKAGHRKDIYNEK